MESWLKRIWLVNGLLIFVLLISFGVAWITSIVPRGNADSGPFLDTRSLPQGVDSAVSQDLSLSLPVRVGRTNTIYALVKVKDLSTAQPKNLLREVKLAEYSSVSQSPAVVNIVFSDIDGSNAHLLLNAKAFISSFSFPNYLDSLQSYILYHIAFYDTDHDGRLTQRDSAQIYISDLNGKDLQPLLPKNIDVITYDQSSDGRSIFLLTRSPIQGHETKAEDWPERVMVYDVHSRLLRPFFGGVDWSRKAQDILWSK